MNTRQFMVYHHKQNGNDKTTTVETDITKALRVLINNIGIKQKLSLPLSCKTKIIFTNDSVLLNDKEQFQTIAQITFGQQVLPYIYFYFSGIKGNDSEKVVEEYFRNLMKGDKNIELINYFVNVKHSAVCFVVKYESLFNHYVNENAQYNRSKLTLATDK